MPRPMAILVGAALTAALAAAAFAQDERAELNTVMARYLRLWNAHDAKTITRSIYRLEPTHPWATEAGLKAEFDRLKAQGYSHSDIHGLSACLTGPDTGQVDLRFVRLKTDGAAMPPGERLSIYRLKKFDDGWRVVGMAGGNLETGMTCAAPGK